MTIKNYTSQISAMRSIGLIEAKLAAKGASQILKEYDPEGKVEGIAFIIKIDGVDMPFKLPAKVDECGIILKSRYKKLTASVIKNIRAQAERTSWKVVLDFVDVMLAMIELRQAEFMQVFMPYLYDHSKRQTYFEKVKEKGFQKLLPSAEK